MLGAVLLAALAVAPPSHLVERVVTTPQQTRRVSVFRDGTAVVALRQGLDEPHVIRQELQPLELRVLLQVIDETYQDLARLRPPEFAPGGTWVELRLAPSERAPLVVRLPLAGTPHAAVVRISQALDGIENRLLADPVDRENLSSWAPAVGERVRLEDGRVVEVRSISGSEVGVIVTVEVVGNPVRQVFMLEELRRQAVRRVVP